MERTAAEATRHPTDGLPTEDRITRDMLKVIAELQIEEDDQALHQLRVVDQMGGPQQLLPAADPVPAGRHARAARGVHRPPARLSGVHGRERQTPARRARVRADRAAHRGRADDRPDRADARRSRSSGDRAVHGQGRIGRRPRARPRRRPRRRLPGRRGLPRHAARRLPGRRAARSPASGRRRTATQLYRTAIRSWTTLDLDPEEVHRIGLEELESIEAERRAIATRGRVRRRHGGLPRVTRCRRREHAQTKDELVARATEDIERAHGRRAALLRRPAKGRLRGPAGRGVQGEGRAVRLLLPAVDRRLAARHLLRQRLRPAVRKYTKLATTTYHEAAPGHHFQIALEMENPNLQHVPTPRCADGRRRVRRGLGPLQRATRRRDGPFRTRRSGSACSTGRPGAPPGWSSTPASMRCAGAASGARAGRCRRRAAPRAAGRSIPKRSASVAEEAHLVGQPLAVEAPALDVGAADHPRRRAGGTC